MVKHEKSRERLECLRENYKIVLQKLWKKRDLETLLFLRVAYETGIRGNDILKMDMSCMKGRQILLAEGKRGFECLYQQLNGNYPKVSRQTLRVMEVLYKKQGKFFSASREYYVRKIYRLWEQSPFCFHDLRRSRKLLEIYLLEEQRSVPGGISASKYIFFKKREIINNRSISAVELGYCRNAIDF